MAERQRVPSFAPSALTGPIREYLEQMASAINAMPVFSVFSGTNPNSNVTGLAGDIAVNVSPASNTSRLWVKLGGGLVPDKVSWNTII
jgi:ABC-type cobalamin transport system ATPase subunit